MDPRTILAALRSGTFDRGATHDPTTRAIAEFADWLAFPTELGSYPDDLDVVDTRRLHWPPSGGTTIPVWLLRYTSRDRWGLDPDQLGVGMVGSVTFVLFSYETQQRPVEDVYAIHCYWEARNAGDVRELAAVPPDRARAVMRDSGVTLDGAVPLLEATWTPSVLPRPRAHGALLDEVRVVLLEGVREGAPGWLVSDGHRATWYDAGDFPHEAPATTVAMVHLGRLMLGFPIEHVERRSFLRPSAAFSDDEFVMRYEAALAAVRRAPVEERAEALDSFSPIATHARRYVRHLCSRDRVEVARALIEELAEHAQHSRGYSDLGTLAFEAGLFDLARAFLEKLRALYADHHRSETMALLARIYDHDGKRAEALALLRGCIARIEADEACSPGEIENFRAPLLAALTALSE